MPFPSIHTAAPLSLLFLPLCTTDAVSIFNSLEALSPNFVRPASPAPNLLYCTRTVHEIEKTLAELKLLHAHILLHFPGKSSPNFVALGLSSRKNLCVNLAMVSADSRNYVDAACRKLTASWVRNLAAHNPSVPTCEFFENYNWAASVALLPPGVYTL